MNRDILERNLLALFQRSPDAAQIIGNVHSSDQVTIKTSRTNQMVPYYVREKGMPKPVHSTFDPVKEGKRFYEQNIYEGFVIIFGLGAGFHIKPFLQNSTITTLLIVENHPKEIRTILEHIDLTDIFLDHRVFLWISDDAAQFSDYLLQRYIPVVSGNLQTVSLRPRVLLDQEFFNHTADLIKQTLNQITDDYTVQAHFGKRWFINTLNNLRVSEITTQTLNPIGTAYITAAGPSLEKQIAFLKNKRENEAVIATDTSLPVLLANNIKPDLVISIDCQHISYNHFLQGYPDDVPLVLDLASPTFLTRLAKKIFFFTSDHPLSKYVSQGFRQFPEIDTSGGNVTHAALSLADTLGAKKIYLLGADFSYPYGKPYARNTYIYPYFYSRANRFNDIESQIVSFILHNKSITREHFDKGYRYVTKPMIHYKSSIEKKAKDLSGEVISVPGDGVPLNLASLKNKKNTHIPMIVSAGVPQKKYWEFLADFKKNIKELPPLKGSVISYLNDLTTEQKRTWITMLPVAAQFRKKEDSGIAAIEKAQKWCLDRIERIVALENDSSIIHKTR